VLIAGAAGGVGLACAEAFAARGAELILTDCDGTGLTRAADRLGAFSRYCDAIGSSSVELLAEELAALFPSIDALINAAGRGYVRTLAMARVTRAMLPLLRQARGSRLIVNIASAGGHLPGETMFPYASSPDAFDKLSVMFGEELRGTGIEVVTISPSRINPGIGNPHWSDRVYQMRRTDDADAAERVVGLISAARPEWRHRPPQVNRRA
jgi:NAD(P)-dependent dehydrogenase (short-subunit alcohol dehydrogenase family)